VILTKETRAIVAGKRVCTDKDNLTEREEKMKKPGNSQLVPLAALFILSAAAPVVAQAQPSQQVQPVQQAVSKEYDRQTLENYLAVSAELRKIEQEAARKLQGVNDQQKAMIIEQEAAGKKISAIKSRGFDLQTYNKIDTRVQVDPELKKEIEQISGSRAK
jgi:GTP1/Obg family GTP-binding protein